MRKSVLILSRIFLIAGVLQLAACVDKAETNRNASGGIPLSLGQDRAITNQNAESPLIK